MPHSSFRRKISMSCLQILNFSPPSSPTLSAAPSSTAVESLSLDATPPPHPYDEIHPSLPARNAIKNGVSFSIDVYDVQCTLVLVSNLKATATGIAPLTFLGIPDPEQLVVGSYLAPFIYGVQWLAAVADVTYIGGRNIIDVSPHIQGAFYVVEHTPPGTYHLYRSGEKLGAPSSPPPPIPSTPPPSPLRAFFPSSPSKSKRSGSPENKFRKRRPSSATSTTSSCTCSTVKTQYSYRRLQPFGTRLTDAWKIGEDVYEMFGPEALIPFRGIILESKNANEEEVQEEDTIINDDRDSTF